MPQHLIQLENSILELLVDNLKRLNEEEESDRQGVFHILGMYTQVAFIQAYTHPNPKEHLKIF